MGKIRVDDERDVAELLDKHGIDDHGDIRRANGSRRHHIERTDEAEALHLYGQGSADRFAADIEALRAARSVVARQIDAIALDVAQAEQLGRAMNDGHGPIAAAMSTTFRLRARSADGVVVALTNYHAELTNVLTAIDSTLVGYDLSDSTSKSGLTPRDAV